MSRLASFRRPAIRPATAATHTIEERTMTATPPAPRGRPSRSPNRPLDRSPHRSPVPTSHAATLAMATALGTALLPMLAVPSAMAEGATPVFEITIDDGPATPAPLPADPAVPVPPEGLDMRATDAIGPNERTAARVRRASSPSPVAASVASSALSEPFEARATFDGLEPTPRLNVDTVRQASTAVRGEPLTFRGYWNYPDLVERAQIRVHRRGEARTARPIAVIPVRSGEAVWTVPDAAPDDLSYRLRVHDARGRFDETEATALTLLDAAAPPPVGGASLDDGLEAAGTDRTAVRNIPVRGGLVRVTGTGVAPGETVLVAGRPVPVDADGAFQTDLVVPPGDATVAVELTGPRARVIERDVTVPGSDVFYVALGEVTVGRNIRSGDVLRRAEGEPAEIDVTGRGALYLKGRVRGNVLIEAGLDTGEAHDLDGLWTGLRGRDARALLQRLDPDRYYPVYGDDSDLTDGTPGKGLYVRIRRDDTVLQYGSASVTYEEAELARLDRGVHGGTFQHRSLAQTTHGERRREVTAFVAHNGTVPQIESLLGTGGTVYRLSRQDLVEGTERLTVEVRDRTTGLVRSSLALEPGRDYVLDAVSGRVRLARPLASRAADGGVVREGPRPGDEVFLVARYEYRPTLDDPNGVNAGARARAWLGNQVRVGATAGTEAVGLDGDERRETLGADVIVRHSPGTYVKAEVARSSGPRLGSATSIDGGLSFSRDRAAAPVDGAMATRVEAAADIGAILRGGKEPAPNAFEGTVGGYWEQLERGFTGTRADIAEDTVRYGAHAAIRPVERARLSARADVLEVAGGRRLTASADVGVDVTEAVTVSAGVRHTDVSGDLRVGDPATLGGATGPVLGAAERTGGRTDGAVEIAYAAEDWSLRAFAQGTIRATDERRRNDRAGLGGSVQVTDRLSVEAEVSTALTDGSGGVGGSVGVSWEGDDDVTVALGYGYLGDLASAEARFDRGYTHALTARTTKRFSDYVSVFSEGQLGFTDYATGRDLSHAYGVEIAPVDGWTITGLFEGGELYDTAEGTFDRLGGSGAVAYRGERLSASAALEARRDAGLGRDAEVYAARVAASFAPTDGWTIHGTAEWVEAEGATTAVLDSDHRRFVAAAAYRPVEHDRLNALLKYVHLDDLPPEGQRLGDAFALPRQRSHVASVDAVLDVAPWLTVGGKAALRGGEISADEASLARQAGRNGATDAVLLRQMAMLGAVRLDLHPTENWDVMVEGRVLEVEGVDTLLGGVVGVWRRVGQVKVGAGYSFSSFSDDLTDLTHDEEGWFVNVAAAL